MDTKISKIIGINTLFLIPNKVGGTEYHLRSTLSELEQLDKNNSYIIFCNKENYNSFSFTSKKWTKVLCPIQAENRVVRIIYEQFILPFLVQKYTCNVLHSFGYFGPNLGTFKKITTVHDANWLDHPQDTTILQNIMLKLLMFFSLKTSKLIVTDSEFSKKRLLHHYPQLEKKLAIIEPGVENYFINLLKVTKQTLLKDHHYFLCVSGFYPHKNVLKLLAWWQDQQKNFAGYKLVIVGKNGSEELKVGELIKNTKNVVHYSKVSLTDLASLYKNATASIFPSVYEGFGYPIYEAVMAKTPVFVTTKDLYSDTIHQSITTFTFNNLTTKLLSVKEIKRELYITPKIENKLSYKPGIIKLIDMYNRL